MEHTKKMILVDPRMIDSLQSKAPPVPDAATESLRDMDQQMRGVLDRNDKNLEDKTNLYQQSLTNLLAQCRSDQMNGPKQSYQGQRHQQQTKGKIIQLLLNRMCWRVSQRQ